MKAKFALLVVYNMEYNSNLLLYYISIHELSTHIPYTLGGPEGHVLCLGRHYFNTARKILWSCVDQIHKLLLRRQVPICLG